MAAEAVSGIRRSSRWRNRAKQGHAQAGLSSLVTVRIVLPVTSALIVHPERAGCAAADAADLGDRETHLLDQVHLALGQYTTDSIGPRVKWPGRRRRVAPKKTALAHAGDCTRA